MNQPIEFTPATQKIYIGESNTLVLTFINTSGASMTLTGGTPVNEQKITANGPTSFYLSLGGLLTACQFAQLDVSAPGWTAAYFSGDFASWAVCPSADFTLDTSGSVTFTIGNVQVTGSPAPGNLNIDYYNIPGVQDGSDAVQVSVQNQPVSPSDLDLALTLQESTIYTTLDPTQPIQNILYLNITNNGQTAPNEGGPYFDISFTYSDPPGYGALTTAKLGANIEIQVLQSDGLWSVEPQNQGTSPYWRLKPDPTNSTFLAAGGVMLLEISQIVSPLPANPQPGPPQSTDLCLQSSSVQGYNDGFFSAAIFRNAGPAITALFSDPVNLPAGQDSAPVTLYWSTENVRQVEFKGAGDGSFYPSCGQLSATLNAGKPISMQAYLADTARAATQERGPKFTDSSLSVSMAIESPTVSVSSVALPQHAPGTNILTLNDTSLYIFESSGALIIYDIATGGMTPVDLTSSMPDGAAYYASPIGLSPDGTTIYVLGASGSTSDGPKSVTAVLLTVTVPDNAVSLAAELATVAGGVIGISNAVLTPDGSQLYWGGFLTWNGSAPAELWVIETGTYAVMGNYAWPDAITFPMMLGTSTDGTQAIVGDFSGIYVLDMTSAGAVTSMLPSSAFGANYVPFYWFSHALSSDASQLYVTAGPMTYPPPTVGAMVAIDINPATFELSLAQSVEVTMATDQDTPVGALLLGPNDRWLYCFLVPGQLTIFDTQTLLSGSIQIGSNSYFPDVIALNPAAPNTIYASTGSDWTTMVVTPWPFVEGTGASPPPQRRPRVSRSWLRARDIRASWERGS